MPQSGFGLFGELRTFQPSSNDGRLETGNLSILYCKREDKSVNVWRVVSGHWELHRTHEYLVDNLTFRGPRIVIYSYNGSQRDALFLIFI